MTDYSITKISPKSIATGAPDATLQLKISEDIEEDLRGLTDEDVEFYRDGNPDDTIEGKVVDQPFKKLVIDITIDPGSPDGRRTIQICGEHSKVNTEEGTYFVIGPETQAKKKR